MKAEDLTSQERAAVVAWELARGRKLSTKEIRKLTGLSVSGVSRLMTRLARVLPVWRDDGVWSSL